MHTLADWRAALPRALPSAGWRTRFAPAPTGFLHLGHLVNAMHVWGIARAYGGQVVLRLEDHDQTRCRPEYEQALLDDLDWLGLAPDLFPTTSFARDTAQHPARQSNQLDRYDAAMRSLEARGLVYPCRCTRKDVARRAPHAPGEEPCYPGTCREARVPPNESFARRLRLPLDPVTFHDIRLGPLTQVPAQQCGDLLIRDRHSQWTYQFSVVADDMAHAIDVIIRGEDLLASTGRQLQLAAHLGRTAPVSLLHHTLLLHADGSKLSKATHDTALRDMRTAGARPGELLGLAARRAGLTTASTLAVDDLPQLFV
ncbi:glutamate--tRNA ligase family protein [Gemmatimonas phototrophica]|uniref:glutamate--tRNA ligase family protein n=1 Tax=Gemmatimonas phototrophica TaxID=1379270 RepID=UPI0006A6D7CA|nr:glutamate--tRNA ligase family protein [Gemmatimonas phototrophica]